MAMNRTKAATIGAGNLAPTEIAYQRLNFMHQRFSARAGDIGFCYNQGFFNFDEAPGPKIVQTLNFAAASPFKTLLYPNAFGTFHRYTTITGAPPTASQGNTFQDSDFDADTSKKNYVIDHLTGIGYYVANLGLGNWNQLIDIVRGFQINGLFGWNNWFPITRNCLLSIKEEAVLPVDILRQGILSGWSEGFIFTGETDYNDNTQAYMWWNRCRFTHAAKSSGSSTTMYACRIHYP